MRKTRILIVDDEPNIRVGLRSFLVAKGYEVAEAGDSRSAEVALAADAPDLAIVDERLPDGTGIGLLTRVKESHPGIPVLMLTAHGSIDLAVRAIKAGAEQFLTKPVDMQAVLVLVERLVKEQRSRRRQDAEHARPGGKTPDPFLGVSPGIRRLAEDARRAAEADRPALILGETGTGKGVLARWLHDNGPRSEDPYVDLNCAGLSRDLLDSELFGHEAGAFTGAVKAKTGLLEIADRGTVFLDEIGDMEGSIQARVLKVLDESRFRRLGDVRDRRVDIRLIAATHQDLKRLMEEKKFRQDLYFRVNTFPLRIPSLRERPEDIPLLARHLTERCGAELGRPDVELSEASLQRLQEYTWPGNIRELRSVLERTLMMKERGTIEPGDLRLDVVADQHVSAERPTLLEMERRYIQMVLAAEEGHVTRTARRLGISPSSLYQRLKRFGISASGN